LKKYHRPDVGRTFLVSPRYAVAWNNGGLISDRLPREDTMHGIHCTKRPDHPELDNYRSIGMWEDEDENYVLVKCALFGDVVIETEQGFRAHKAKIVGVYDNGNWTSYEDYQRRTRTDSGSNPYEEEIEWRYRYQAGWGKSAYNPDTYFNPSADS
jgi:hypothetical protein